jgi:hypothetical protein
MTGNDVEVGIEQNRHVKAKGLDALGDLSDLLTAMGAGIPGVRF